MIINKKRTNYIGDLPFQAKYDKFLKTVSFADGYIFDCYDNLSDSSGDESAYFSQGPFFYKSDSSKIFQYNFNDWFYVDAAGSIFKVSLDERNDHNSMRDRFGDNFPNYLIWKAPSSESSGGQQIISENIYLQDKSSGQKKGFSKEVLSRGPDGSIKKRINGSIVYIYGEESSYGVQESIPFEDYIEGINYELKNEEADKTFVIKVELTANVISGRLPDPYLAGYSVDSVSLIEFDENEDYSTQYASLDNPSGIYFFSFISYEGAGSFTIIFSIFNNQLIAFNTSFGD